MLMIGTVVMGVTDVRRAARFWQAALDYVPRDGEVASDGTILVPRAGRVGPGLSLDPSETPPQGRPRVHLDLYTDDQDTEAERLVALGARRVDWPDYPEDADFRVLADPEDNIFCVIDKGPGRG